MIGAVRGWSWSEQHAKFRVKPGVPVHDLAKGLPMLRPSLTQILVAAAGAALVSVPADAQVGRGGWHNGSWYADDRAPQAAERGPPPPPSSGPAYGAPPYPNHVEERRYTEPGRDAWLADCRNRVRQRDSGAGGAVIGGVVGGVAGNRIAGRHNRVVGTVAGAAVGAVAGSAIDRAEDRSRDRDECEAYLDDYYARYAASGYGAPLGYTGYAQPGYAQPTYAYVQAGGCCGQAPVMMVPVQPRPECTETVEYVYEDVPVRHHTYRSVPRRTKIVPDKRVKIVPGKRISTK